MIYHDHDLGLVVMTAKIIQNNSVTAKNENILLITEDFTEKIKSFMIS